MASLIKTCLYVSWYCLAVIGPYSSDKTVLLFHVDDLNITGEHGGL
jgi:hypothetical protein